MPYLLEENKCNFWSIFGFTGCFMHFYYIIIYSIIITTSIEICEDSCELGTDDLVAVGLSSSLSRVLLLLLFFLLLLLV